MLLALTFLGVCVLLPKLIWPWALCWTCVLCINSLIRKCLCYPLDSIAWFMPVLLLQLTNLFSHLCPSEVPPFFFFFPSCVMVACERLVHRPGFELRSPPALEALIPNLWTTREYLPPPFLRSRSCISSKECLSSSATVRCGLLSELFKQFWCLLWCVSPFIIWILTNL